jgi:hypothetical protein
LDADFQDESSGSMSSINQSDDLRGVIEKHLLSLGCALRTTATSSFDIYDIRSQKIIMNISDLKDFARVNGLISNTELRSQPAFQNPMTHE